MGWVYSDCDEPSQVSHEGKRWACCLIALIGYVSCVNVSDMYWTFSGFNNTEREALLCCSSALHREHIELICVC